MLKKWFDKAGTELRSALFGYLPFVLFGRPLALSWKIASCFNPRVRVNGAVRAEIGREVLKIALVQSQGAHAMPWREALIDRRIYHGRQRRGTEVWPDLENVAVALATEISRINAENPGQPVIVSPFHYVSQYANIYVIDALRAVLKLESISVVSGVPNNQFGDDDAQIPGVKVLYTYGDAHRNGLGLRVARALRRNGAAVLFSDVPPFTLHRYPMQTVEVSMFGRSARIHNGVFRLGTPLGAKLLAFYLKFERGRFSARIFDPLPLAAADAPQQLADYIEKAMTENYADWLFSGHPSMYAFSPSK